MTKSGDQGAEIRDQESVRMMQLLRDAMPRAGDHPGKDRDLWPAMLQRIDDRRGRGAALIPWFDWALAGGLVTLVAIAPRTIPVILYYL